MKKIQAFVGSSIKVSDKVVALQPTLDQIDAARNNGYKVMASALSIERHMERIIEHFFFGHKHPKKELFGGLILASDWCSFSAKQKLILFIVEDGNHFFGSEKNTFEKLLRKAMTYRNAFAHGELWGSADGPSIKYFQGRPKEDMLTDDYWTQVEADLYNCHLMIQSLELKTGTTFLESKQESETNA